VLKCVVSLQRANGQNHLKKRKKFIYLISPNKIQNEIFYTQLNNILKTKKVAFFQLRMKNEKLIKLINTGKKINKICKKYKVKFIVNDSPVLAKKIGADGCHLGQKDMRVLRAKKILKDKIIGVTCHNSKKLVKKAKSRKVDYIALGSFFKTNTKKVKYRANIKILKDVKKITNIPIVAIGGINNKNYGKLLLNNANFLAISSYIWNNKNLSPEKAIEKIL